MLTRLLRFDELNESAVSELAELEGVRWFCWLWDRGTSYVSATSLLIGEMQGGAGELLWQFRVASQLTGTALGGTS